MIEEIRAMRITAFALTFALLIALVACERVAPRAEDPPAAAPAAPAGAADLMDAKGNKIGTATLTQTDKGVRIKLQVSGLPPGEHAFHIHAAGKCEPPEFKSAGGHFNPHGKKHGLQNPDGPHAGDLPNIKVADDGTCTVDVVAELVTLGDGANSLFAGEGTSLMIHEKADDNVSDPAGNAGARIACGTIRKVEAGKE